MNLEFVLADGTTLSRGVSECTFDLEDRRATSPVVLGETEDEALLGAVTLETLGLMLNPLTRTLQPLRMVLAGTALSAVRRPAQQLVSALVAQGRGRVAPYNFQRDVISFDIAATTMASSSSVDEGRAT